MRSSSVSLDRIIRQYLPPTRCPTPLRPGLWTLIKELRIRVLGQPTIASKRREVARKEPSIMAKAGFHAVRVGRQPGIYTTWAEAEAQVKGFSAAEFKKFPTRARAEEFMGGTSRSSAPTPYSQSTSARSSSTSASISTVYSDPGPRKVASFLAGIIDPSRLPSDLREIAEKGYSFSEDKQLIVYTDGSGLGNGKMGARAGLGVFWGHSGEAGSRNLSERVPGTLQTNNRGELLAAIRAIEECPYPSVPLEIRTDSQYTIGCMTIYLPKWIENGFRTGGQSIKNRDLVLHLMVLMSRRKAGARITFKYVEAHSGIEGNEVADKLAKRGAMSLEVPDRTDWLDPNKESASRSLGSRRPIEVDVEVDESWLMTEEEMLAFEKDFQLQA